MKKFPIFFMLFFWIFILSFTIVIPPSLAADCTCICNKVGGGTEDRGPQPNPAACATLCGTPGAKSCEYPTIEQTVTPATGGSRSAGDCGDGQICLTDPLNINGAGPQVLWARIIQALLFFVGVGALVTFVYAGFMFLTSSGNPEQVKKAKDTMLYAAIGAAVSIGSYTILSYILSILQGASGNY